MWRAFSWSGIGSGGHVVLYDKHIECQGRPDRDSARQAGSAPANPEIRTIFE
jgi:hypothetical protein